MNGVIGAVLAGGGGSRMGGGKAAAMLAGRPLAAYPAEVLAQVCERVAVVCKPDTELPLIRGAERWDEPVDPRHPITGIAYALERADGPVLVCAADMPFVTADACRSLIEAAGGRVLVCAPDWPLVTADACRSLIEAAGGAGAVDAAVAIAGGVLQPVLGLYAPTALAALRSAPENARLTDTVAALDPVRVALP